MKAFTAVIAVLVVVVVAGVSRSFASPARVADLGAVSGGSGGLPAACIGDGTEREVALAASAGGRRLVVGWIQSAPPADLNFAAASRNGGATWRTTALPGLTKCTGGEPDRSVDPSVSFGADGRAYFGSLVNYPTTLGRFAYDVFANRSSDGGSTWSSPAVVDPASGAPDRADDFPTLVADPTRAGRAYMTWSRLPPSSVANEGIYLSRTQDGGRSWSPPRLVHAPPPGMSSDFARPVVLSDGRLLVVFAEGSFTSLVGGPGTSTVLATRSADGGRSWSPPVEIVERSALDVADPDSGRHIPSRVPSVASGRDGRTYVAWSDSPSAGTGRIIVSRSANAGHSWSRALTVARVGGQAFQPTVAVGARGTVGVSWYDFGRDRPGDAVLTTDVWFAHSHSRGRHWRRTHLAGPFDVRTAYGDGKPLGDFQGLVATRHGFAAAFVQARPAASHGPSDVFVAKILLRHR